MSKPAFLVDAYGLALNLAVNGNGVALVNAVIAGEALRSGKVELAHPQSCPASDAFFLSLERPHEKASAFTRWLKSLTESENP